MDKYRNIISLPHKQSSKRPQMSRIDRAAQFAPFAALTGYDAAIKETGRLTDERIELSEESLANLNYKFQILSEHLDDEPELTITYFKADDRKAGGAYLEVTGVVKKADTYERIITMKSGQKISMDDIFDIDLANIAGGNEGE